MTTITLSVQEGAERIETQCNAAFEMLNRLDEIHSRLDDDSSLDEALDAAEGMGDEAWEIRKTLADIRKIAASIAAWAADPATDGQSPRRRSRRRAESAASTPATR